MLAKASLISAVVWTVGSLAPGLAAPVVRDEDGRTIVEAKAYRVALVRESMDLMLDLKGHDGQWHPVAKMPNDISFAYYKGMDAYLSNGLRATWTLVRTPEVVVVGRRAALDAVGGIVLDLHHICADSGMLMRARLSQRTPEGSIRLLGRRRAASRGEDRRPQTSPGIRRRLTVGLAGRYGRGTRPRPSCSDHPVFGLGCGPRRGVRGLRRHLGGVPRLLPATHTRRLLSVRRLLTGRGRADQVGLVGSVCGSDPSGTGCTRGGTAAARREALPIVSADLLSCAEAMDTAAARFPRGVAEV